LIVFDDADIEMAVKGGIASNYRKAGQTCVCANRILVQDSVNGAFTRDCCFAALLAMTASTVIASAAKQSRRQKGQRVGKVQNYGADAAWPEGSIFEWARVLRRACIRYARNPSTPLVNNAKLLGSGIGHTAAGD